MVYNCIIVFLNVFLYRLDRKSSRGMLYENEELRLRTININAEVERGKNFLETFLGVYSLIGLRSD